MNWASFLGAIIGGLLGAVTTIIAFRYTYKQNETQHKETVALNKIENKVTQTRLEEQNRIQVLPYIYVESDTSSNTVDAQKKTGKVLGAFSGTPKFYATSDEFRVDCSPYIKLLDDRHSNLMCLTFRNLGNGIAVNCFLQVIKSIKTNTPIGTSMPIDCLTLSSKSYCYILLPEEGKICSFRLYYNDLQGRKYEQYFQAGIRKLQSEVNQKLFAVPIPTITAPKLVLPVVLPNPPVGAER